MNNDTLFGLEIERNKNTMVTTVVGLVIRVGMAVTTAGFFYMYAPNIFAWLVGNDFSPYISAAMGAVFIDGLAAVWNHLRLHDADTDEQLLASQIGVWLNMALTITVTVVFVVLLTEFIELRNADGSFNNIGMLIQLGGILSITVAFAGNSALWAYYVATSSEAVEAKNTADLLKRLIKGTIDLKKADMTQTISHTLTEIQGKLPDATKQAGQQNAGQYLNTRFNQPVPQLTSAVKPIYKAVQVVDGKFHKLMESEDLGLVWDLADGIKRGDQGARVLVTDQDGNPINRAGTLLQVDIVKPN